MNDKYNFACIYLNAKGFCSAETQHPVSGSTLTTTDLSEADMEFPLSPATERWGGVSGGKAAGASEWSARVKAATHRALRWLVKKRDANGAWGNHTHQVLLALQVISIQLLITFIYPHNLYYA